MKKKIFSPITSGTKKTSWFAVTLSILMVFASGCTTLSTPQIEVGEMSNSAPGQPNMNIALNEVMVKIIPHLRLVKHDVNYQYLQSDIIGIPLQPNRYAYYLVVTAEVTSTSTSSSKTFQKLYCELLNKEGHLFFIPDNFQQSCSSTTCAHCELIMYQNGSFGCECNGSPTDETSSCTYEKSRILTKKQQKSDII